MLSCLQHCRYRNCDGVVIAIVDFQNPEVLDLSEPPTAIMYPDDFSFIGGQTEIRKRGLRIPDDISVCGYDGINLSKIINPQLTTWYQDAAGIGRESVRKLIESIEGDRNDAVEQIMVSGKFLMGNSVKRRD